MTSACLISFARYGGVGYGNVMTNFLRSFARAAYPNSRSAG